ncbi:MAG: Holliday junction resolvase RuvX [Flavobacteriales bacterium]|nr:Holliday junction resolvase RuvX [Flavobacteriales bacterium]
MARILAIDYGEKRTGLAVTDVLQIISNGLETVETSDLMDFLKSYLAQEEVEAVVIGLPTGLNNELSAVESSIQIFINKFKARYPKIPVIREDERFTSSIAAASMIAGGVKKSKRRNKGLLDKISATLILQSYLERKQRL